MTSTRKAGAAGRRVRREFSAEFKAEAVRRAAERRAAGGTLAEVGREFDVRPDQVRAWARAPGGAPAFGSAGPGETIEQENRRRRRATVGSLRVFLGSSVNRPGFSGGLVSTTVSNMTGRSSGRYRRPKRAMREVQLANRWAQELETVAARIGQLVPRPESRGRAGRFLRATVAGGARRNGWQLAEAAGEATPHGMQQLLASAAREVEAVRGDLRACVRERLGPGGVRVVDETGFLKKGTQSAGGQRQYSGTAGRIENCQIGVFLAYTTARGHAFIDRELYVPASWTDDRARCREAGLPDAVPFRTKPQLARAMVARALDGGLRPPWVLGDEGYGNAGALRRWLAARGQAFVLATRATTTLWGAVAGAPGQHAAARVADALSARAWPRHGAGAGSKGPRDYQWAVAPLLRLGAPGYHALLVRRHPTSGERAYYVVFAPRRVALPTLARVAGRRWAIEQGFEASTQEVGLDENMRCAPTARGIAS